MTRAKSPRTAKRTSSGGARAGGGWRLSATAWRRTWALLGWSLAIAAVVVGMRRLQTFVNDGRPIVDCTLGWVDLPDWFADPGGAEILRDIETAADLRPDDDPHDANLCARVTAGLQQSPWIAEVQEVRKQPDGVVRVQATFREPYAFIEASGVAHLVDRDGVRLPSQHVVDFVQDRFWNEWLRVVGVVAPVPDEGQPWPGTDVAAALDLIDFFNDAAARGELPFRSSLRAIDVANYDGRVSKYDAKIRIRTIYPRSYINWGVPPGQEYDVESSARRKLALLLAFYGQHGDQFPDGWVYDVRGPDGVRRWEFAGG